MTRAMLELAWEMPWAKRRATRPEVSHQDLGQPTQELHSAVVIVLLTGFHSGKKLPVSLFFSCQFKPSFYPNVIVNTPVAFLKALTLAPNIQSSFYPTEFA